MVDKMVERGLSPRTIVQGYRVLSSALAQAVRWEMIQTNPAKAVRPPRIERAELTIPQPDEVRAILTASDGTWLHLPILLAATTGMRRGEVFALRWRDVDLDAGLIRVTGSLQRVGGKQKVVEPKTSRSRRTVALPGAVVTGSRCPPERAGPATSGARRRMDGPRPSCGAGRRHAPRSRHRDTQVCRVRCSRGVARCAVARPAPRLCNEPLKGGIHPKVVSEALGHASTAFTMDVYSHVLPSMQDEAARAIEGALSLG